MEGTCLTLCRRCSPRFLFWMSSCWRRSQGATRWSCPLPPWDQSAAIATKCIHRKDREIRSGAGPHPAVQKGWRTFGPLPERWHGLKVGAGTIVDATIIGAPSSTKNKEKKRDPEMHQTRKGKQYYFGMRLAGQAQYRWSRLTSNVRPHNASHGGGTRHLTRLAVKRHNPGSLCRILMERPNKRSP